jgi:hypothetical protein
LLAVFGSLPRRLWLAAALALAVGGCLSPTLPLPPPSKPDVSGPDENGEVTLRGTVQPRAEVFAANMRTGEIRGQITLDDGIYEFKLPAQVDDEVTLWYTVGTKQSQGVTFRIRDPNL